jgi:hypothetical protein
MVKTENFLAFLAYSITINASPSTANVASALYLVSPNYRLADFTLQKLIVNLPHFYPL